MKRNPRLKKGIFRSARIARRAPGGEEPATLQALQQPAQIAGVEVELAGELGSGALAPVPDFVQQARLGQRKRAAEQTGAQRADTPCVESIEAAYRIHLHRRTILQLLAFVK